MEENKLRADHLIVGFLATAIGVCMLSSFPYIINNESLFTLIIFNSLFVSFIFPLNGTLTKKALMLLLGNTVGIFLNFLFRMLVGAASYSLGQNTFYVIYAILSPFLNLTWMVSFWSISLTFVGKSRNAKRRPRFDD